MAKKDYYEILGVSRNESPDEIKKAYRKLARKYHPDVNVNSKTAESRFKEISEAYDTLSDPDKKKKYDLFGHQAARSDFDPTRAYSHDGPGFEGFDNIFRGEGAGFQDIFSDLFGAAHRGRPAGPRAGHDVQYSMEISFEDAARGMKTSLNLNHEKISVKIPPGVDSGSKIRLPGKGGPGISGGPRGDLYIVTQVRPHPYLERKGDHIYLEVPVSFAEAILGAKIRVPTIEGMIQLTIPPGTQSGQKLRIAGKGFPHLRGGGRGDQFVVIKITVPKKVDTRSEQLIRDFERLNPEDPRSKLKW
ncbi:MAG: hypothetical protein CO150_09880 [Nitrospirae bacterium CG_4_9_14_3_um_filter_53_35]|nr:MAG: hypothetical protein AUK29_10905 [Nitrospirae bacterium CG2_30_53_67]PIS37898.1 MAG: hypothetical protein COT35_03615 [Nitrospirae bacterium CG08_land_8_20_14_0_20_52_24]PIV83149.1 MAG: hypothetical protein COW52_09790 [Nitrospirae bacterium CG17_big_fil_post_rev_8_21_14_2_50_50_9]PIW85877.1 MAG: hypothetical protein COZ95_02160 [Nitrospirae bacterium CG_4_8_14_3_um_filter_50_41]PIX85185.1 MAG: hypothetical protein COZ32_09780 [Nitrospirae bacterium CG_4_10_14_3_um_filter_53_41]PJA7286